MPDDAPAAVASPSHRQRLLRHWLKRLHLWVGLSVGVAYALIALSGSVLALQEPLLRLAHPSLMAHALPDASQRAAVLTRIAAEWPPVGLRTVDLPTAALPVWQLYFADGTRRYIDPADGHLLLTRAPGSDPLLTVRDWHTHLLAGEAGENLLGVIGWLTLGLMLSGLWLWWPDRRKLRDSLRTYAQPPTRRWLTWHRSVGALGLPLLALVTLTGTLMVYNAGARHALQAIFRDAPAPIPPTAIAPIQQPINWAAALAAAQRVLPGAELHRISLPSATDGRVIIRARVQGEWHTVGRSQVWLDPWRARVLAAIDATAEGTGARVSNAIYPLHAGSVGGVTGKLLVLLSGLLPPFLLVTGFLFWRSRTRRRG
jgi:uncharacterized iron-regulated membrane protein